MNQTDPESQEQTFYHDYVMEEVSRRVYFGNRVHVSHTNRLIENNVYSDTEVTIIGSRVRWIKEQIYTYYLVQKFRRNFIRVFIFPLYRSSHFLLYSWSDAGVPEVTGGVEYCLILL